VILKTGRNRKAGEELARMNDRSVNLVRNSQPFDNARCGDVAPFGEGQVSPRSYDDYHDVGLSTADDATLNRFHFKYAGRGKRCPATSSNVGDSLSFYARTNRGQFSFDTNVVDTGTYFQPFVFLHVTTASASSEKLAKQRVETRQYRLSKGTPECIVFPHAVPTSAAFLRINDLEGLAGFGIAGPKRAPEHRWSLSLP
jgi:hypothetical protein